MSLTNVRSQSLPPSYALTVKGARIAKPLPRSAGTQCRSSRHKSPRSWGVTVDDISGQTELGCPTPDSVCASNSLDTSRNSKTSNGSRLNADPVSSFGQAFQYLQTTLTHFFNDRNTDQDGQSLFEAADAVARIGEDRGLLSAPASQCTCSPKHECGPASRSKREEQAIRKGILERAAKEHSKGKVWTQHRVLAAYGRQEIELDGQKATIEDMGRHSWCTECEGGRRHCILVEKDRFWSRGQCVECVQRKISCSLDKFGSKRKKPEG